MNLFIFASYMLGNDINSDIHMPKLSLAPFFIHTSGPLWTFWKEVPAPFDSSDEK